MKLLNKVLSYFPTSLPVGVTAFEKWSEEIFDLSGRFADQDSMRFVLANAVLSASDEKPFFTGIVKRRAKIPKNEFVQLLRRAAANQIASQVFTEIKYKQAEAAEKAKIEAAKTKQLAEDTAALTVVLNEPVQNKEI